MREIAKESLDIVQFHLLPLVKRSLGIAVDHLGQETIPGTYWFITHK